MKVAFFGTPAFAALSLERLLESDHEIVGVVTQPDRPKGRGQKMLPPPVKEIALREELPVAQPPSIKKPPFGETLRAWGADIAVVVAYGQILPADLLTVPKFGFLNVHASLLPKYRGAAPIQWAIGNGERMTGVSIMQVEAGLDTGPVLAQREAEILEDDDARSVHDLLGMLGAQLLVECLDDIQKTGRVKAEPQDDAKSSYAPLIERKDARIDWKQPAEKIICKIRGFVLWPGAYSKREDEIVKFLAAEAVDPAWIELDWKDERLEPGTVVETLKGRGFVVKAGDSLVLVTRVQFPGKKEMESTDAMNGGLVKVGMKFA